MRNTFKFALLALFVAAVLVGPAGAATIHDSIADIPNVTYTPYKVAYEIYDNGLGINADAVPVYIHNTATMASGQSKNLRVFNGKVNLSGQKVMLTAPATQITFSGDPCSAALPATVIIGESETGAVPSADVSINIYEGARFCQRNIDGGTGGSAFTVSAGASTYIAAALGNVNTVEYATITLADALNFNIDPGLNPACGTPRYVQLAYISNQETAQPTNILVITPQFTVSRLSNLNAELDTDFDFTQFVPGSGPLVWNFSSDSGQVFRINNLQAATPTEWKAWVAETNTGSYTFQLNSANTQPGISVYTHDATSGNVSCTPNAAATTFTCSLTGQVINTFTFPAGKTSIVIHNSARAGGPGTGTIEMNPTVWSISNARITISGGTQTDICQVPSGQVGVWYGGLEAIVPFVKGDVANGYETYIKLFNRYTKDAKLYVATFVDGINGDMIISTTQIAGKEVIPMQSASNPNGVLQITSADIASICPTCNMVTGIPVKFLIRVPGQKGSGEFDGMFVGDIGRADDDDDVVGDTWGVTENFNQSDPYVDGVVVSTSSQGQRTIPLKFRRFMNGEYNQ
jgi:hypothetical protein